MQRWDPPGDFEAHLSEKIGHQNHLLSPRTDRLVLFMQSVILSSSHFTSPIPLKDISLPHPNASSPASGSEAVELMNMTFGQRVNGFGVCAELI